MIPSQNRFVEGIDMGYRLKIKIIIHDIHIHSVGGLARHYYLQIHVMGCNKYTVN